MPRIPGTTDFNLQSFLRAIGERGGGGEYQFARTIQPVVNLADFTNLTPSHEPPVGQFGGAVPAAAGEHAAVRLTSLGKGGTYILDSWFQTVPGSGVARFTRNSALVFIGALAAPPFLYSEDPILSTMESGTVLNANLPAGATTPTFGSDFFPPGLWIPPGGTWEMFALNGNTLLSWGVTISDVPVSQGGDR